MQLLQVTAHTLRTLPLHPPGGWRSSQESDGRCCLPRPQHVHCGQLLLLRRRRRRHQRLLLMLPLMLHVLAAVHFKAATHLFHTHREACGQSSCTAKRSETAILLKYGEGR